MTVGDRPIRVLHAISRYGTLSEGFVADAVATVERDGWQSWVLCRDIENRETFPSPPDERIVRWTAPSDVGRRLSLARVLDAAGRAAGPAIARIEPGLVHAHFGWNLLDVVSAARALRVPVVATFHASDVTVFPQLGRRLALVPGWRRHGHRYAPVFPHVAAGIAVSEHIAGLVRDLGFVAPLEVIPAGIWVERFPFRPPELDRAGVRLVFVGRLVRRKGLDVLLRAMALASTRDQLSLDVVGDGAEAAALRALAGECGLGEAVRFHGSLPRSEVARVLAASDLLVMPSRTMDTGEIEGSPVVTKEAQAIGLPVIATDNGGTRETLPPEHREQIVAEEDPRALAAALDESVRSRAAWPERAALARGWVEEQFDWARLGDRTLGLYRRVLADRGAP